jgi:CRP-like cAMP-binding protein
MLDAHRVRIGRELLLAAMGLPLDVIDSWAIDRLTWLLDEQFVHAGELLYAAGDPADFIYFMHDGKLRLTREGAAPWTFEGRWLIGGFEAFADRPRDRNAVALKDFPVLRIPTGAWIDLLEDNFALARAAVLQTARAVAQLEDRVPDGPPPARQDPPRVGSGPLTLVERLALLGSVQILRGGGVQALADLASASEEAFFESGEAILERGAEGTHLHLIVGGEVDASRVDPAARRSYGPGDIVCGVASFGSSAVPWEARARVATRVLSFSSELWFDLMEEHFDMVRSTLAAIAERRALLIEFLAERSGGIVFT